MTVKKIIGKVHLWLGLASGLVVLFLGLTGCILAFQREIENNTQSYRYVSSRSEPLLPPSRMKEIAAHALPGKRPHSVTYGKPGDAAVITFYHGDPGAYFYLLYVDPYTGAVLKVKDMDQDFFRIVVNGHFYLWLPPAIGKPIVASATLIFLVMMVTGIVLWWPKNKAARKQRFSVKWNARWRRRNYDLHNVLGFYMSWVAIFIAITGLVWGFEWAANSVYWATSGGKSMPSYYEPVSTMQHAKDAQGIDVLWSRIYPQHPRAEAIELHYPETDSSAIAIGINPDASTYWKIDNIYFDQYSLSEIPVTHLYGRFAKTSVADKIARMNYDIHVGAALGLSGKILAFCTSLLAASLPVTGFLIFLGRRKTAKAKTIKG